MGGGGQVFPWMASQQKMHLLCDLVQWPPSLGETCLALPRQDNALPCLNPMPCHNSNASSTLMS